MCIGFFRKRKTPPRQVCAATEVLLSIHSSAVLVTEYVGRRIWSSPGGILLVENSGEPEVLGAKEIPEIRRVALRGLQMLHESGFVHGDIALRNLRVEMRKEGLSTRNKTRKPACKA